MKPYAEINSKKVYLPQEVDPHRFEVCSVERNGTTQYLLCPKVKTRYVQATGLVMTIEGNEFAFAGSHNKLARGTVSLEGTTFTPVKADWGAGSSISIKHEDAETEADETNAE